MSGVGSSTSSGTPVSLVSLCPATATGRKSATAAAMTTTSACRPRSAIAASISAAVSTRTTRQAGVGRQRGGDGRHERHVGAPAQRGGGQRVALLARRAVGEVAHRVDRLAGPAGADAATRRPARSPRAPSIAERRRATIAAGSASRPTPTSPPASGPDSGGDHGHPPAHEGGQVLADARVLPHLGVHGRAHEHRGPGGEQGRGQAGRRPGRPRSGRGSRRWPAPPRRGRPTGRARVCGIGEASSNRTVWAGSEASAEKVTVPTKRGGVGGEHRGDVHARVDEAPADLDRLVGGDAPGDPEDDPRAAGGPLDHRLAA